MSAEIRRARAVLRQWFPVEFSNLLAYAAVVALPSLITLLSFASSPNGLGPFDARTGQQVAGSQLVMPIWESIFEPLLALFYIIADAKDYSSTTISISVWLFAAFLVGGVALTPGENGVAVRIWRAFLIAIGAELLLWLYLFFAALVPLPGWVLTTDNPNQVIADLHSHTTGSHDAFVSASQSESLHRERGFNVVALTEHYSSQWKSIARHQTDSKTPGAIIGVEISIKIERRRHYLVLLGVDPNLNVGSWLSRLHNHSDLRDFISAIHNSRGAVIALSLGLQPMDVDALINDGVDAFEIANFGHPRMDSQVRAALLKAENRHVVLLADSDWHGWSGFFRTWNLVSGDGQGLQPAKLIDALRMRKSEQFVPVVSRMFESPSAAGKIFSPFSEMVRYAQQLSPLRVLSWWVWSFLLYRGARTLKQRGINVAGTTVLLFQASLGAAIAVRGAAVIANGLISNTFPYPIFLGSLAVIVGAMAIMAAWFTKGAINRTNDLSPLRMALIQN